MRIEKTTRWSWIAVLAVGLARPAAAEDAVRVAEPAVAPAPTPAPERYRLAILDMPAPGERAQAAGLVVAAVREAVQADQRLDVVPDRLVEQARVVWGGDVLVLGESGLGSGLDGASDDLTQTQACAIGHAAGAERLLVVSGYELALSQVPGGTQARLGARLTLLNIGSCQVREQEVVRATGASAASAEETLAATRGAFATAVQDRLQGLLPLHSAVRAVSPIGGEMAHGARNGVQPGQYFDVHRHARVVGQVYVDDVAPDSARVSLVRGVPRLQAGDQLVERKAVRTFEVGVTATPTVLERTGGDDAFGVAMTVHGVLYRPVGSNMYGFTVEWLGLTDGFSRWRVGIDIGRQVRILPRRLFAYGRVGAGMVWARQELRYDPPFDDFFGGAHLRGFQINDALGVKYVLGDGLVLHLQASLPIPLYRVLWYYDWNTKWTVFQDMLHYPSPHRLVPSLALGFGWAF